MPAGRAARSAVSEPIASPSGSEAVTLTVIALFSFPLTADATVTTGGWFAPKIFTIERLSTRNVSPVATGVSSTCKSTVDAERTVDGRETDLVDQTANDFACLEANILVIQRRAKIFDLLTVDLRKIRMETNRRRRVALQLLLQFLLSRFESFEFRSH